MRFGPFSAIFCCLVSTACSYDYSAGNTQQVAEEQLVYSTEPAQIAGGRYDPATDTFIPAQTRSSGAPVLVPVTQPALAASSTPETAPAAVTFSAPSYGSGIVGDMRNISAFCLNYIETGHSVGTLLGAGFSAKGRTYKKSYNASIIGGTKPVISVDPRQTRSGASCSAQFGIIGRNDGYALIDEARRSIVARGYSPVKVQSSRGTKTAYQNGNTVVRIGGRVSSGYGSYSTFVYFERQN
jgi:hypothetical protein